MVLGRLGRAARCVDCMTPPARSTEGDTPRAHAATTHISKRCISPLDNRASGAKHADGTQMVAAAYTPARRRALDDVPQKASTLWMPPIFWSLGRFTDIVIYLRRPCRTSLGLLRAWRCGRWGKHCSCPPAPTVARARGRFLGSMVLEGGDVVAACAPALREGHPGGRGT